ncbi:MULTISPECIES: hypothetical protein, partial [Pseudomonas]|uniref:hypothetical protein n=2 Tax=Pseudomonas TaxID=286 RepID=UPI001E5A84BF
ERILRALTSSRFGGHERAQAGRDFKQPVDCHAFENIEKLCGWMIDVERCQRLDSLPRRSQGGVGIIANASVARRRSGEVLRRCAMTPNLSLAAEVASKGATRSVKNRSPARSPFLRPVESRES